MRLEEIKARARAGETVQDLAEAAQERVQVMRDKLRAAGVPIYERPQKPRAEATRTLTEAYLRDAYLTRERTYAEIRAETGASLHSIHRYLKQYKIPRRPPVARARKLSAAQKTEIRQKAAEGVPKTQLAAEAGVSRTIVYRVLGSARAGDEG